MRKIFPVLAFLAFAAVNVHGETPEEQKRTQAGDLSLRIKSINFAVNNEYFNPIVEGYTMLGFFLQPELIYSPVSNISLMGGVHLLKYYGTEKFSRIRPVFSTTLRFSDRTALTLGTLTGPDKHRFYDPHFHRERLYNEYVEDGVQLTYINEHLFTDTYISWENFISRGDSAREEFTAGESLVYSSPVIAGFLKFEIPVQVQFKHYGGQISDYEGGIDSFINTAAGLRLIFDLNDKKTSRAGIEYIHFVNNMREGDSFEGINHGRASWARAFFSYKAFRLEEGYWNGHDFYAPNGNPVFSSVSTYKKDVVIHHRQLVTTSASLKFFPASALEFYFGVDLYYDPDLNRLDQAYLLHLNFDKLISLLSKKQDQKK